MSKEQFKLTERGLFWLKIDTANTFGLDKLTHDEQVQWFDDTIAINRDMVNGLISSAESPFEFKQCLENYEMYLNNEPVNGLMYVDCSNQALQCYAVLTGDLKTAKVCNLAGQDDRADGYQMLADSINSHFDKPFITRAVAKKPMMVTLYGKQKAWELMIDTLAENLPSVDVNSEKFQTKINDIFKESMNEIAPNAMKAMASLQKLNDENIGTYYWTLPDGFKVQYDVKSETHIKAERITKNGQKISIEDIIAEYKPKKNNAGMAPNVIHSVDGYICRELIRRSTTHITTIHDAYAVHYNFIDELISNYKDIMIELLHSNLLNDIMTEIANGRNFKSVTKSNTLNKFHIRNSRYALS